MNQTIINTFCLIGVGATAIVLCAMGVGFFLLVEKYFRDRMEEKLYASRKERRSNLTDYLDSICRKVK